METNPPAEGVAEVVRVYVDETEFTVMDVVAVEVP
jgi:hypothetical protein